ncbi:unnamed protein product [Schistocephalus solidus]|uniref:IGv domain-containing protein n=1 Tax=Schistocephalus solidus TaxID=70667 RepID=A0A183SCY6_SCHSO|nr:unnamed protein product [Schistocephalus solidus]
MLQWRPLTGIQLSPVALSRGHTPVTASTSNLNQMGWSGVMCPPHPVIFFQTSHIFPSPLQVSYGEGEMQSRRRPRQSEEQPTETDNGTSRTITGAVLSETLFSEQGQLEEVGASYTFWNGYPKSTGVAFNTRNDIGEQLPWLLQNPMYADRKETKILFKTSKATYGPFIKGTVTLLSSEGTTLLVEKSQMLMG